ncbi:cytochrome P450 family protein [Mycolicibacterium hassiacum DSM 44199]|mgnify:CR=1 FL=1|jgi:cytochrome P450|uniref:Steroid C26-monooxygenase n=1 Tax=Mycolicibacterium hassiacum (strain DSM 44199 / CIP 105218 / JCM 12690 / 3849) TaxID=1122247 RepID=K5BI25_MYCHD|nr:cytochrome P450 [Mycolicibacterium hassiacum]EKF25581.1 cytochrome P450 family protein [Mycolicibacterium hassiacum DSM 44199]MBX5485156.1 cytochrome P450 [Mycolicibacterium hassiacum]MDA4084501.1 cytochrome P450 [Mycolicibacterium hassiacum DSM 44199]PZN24046.1 MAG: cytochrome P450 [Mycolicibacterium hassiacum]VCT90856.1 Putative cytochrome P450 123 [Mycolicibacterium hassiacum DSM 44199]
MTTASQLVFDPFSEEFFNGPWEIYRRMREEAPVYYNEEYDFYALSRHEDVAAAYKDWETFSSAYGLDLAMVKSGEPPMIKAIILMDPPEHRQMRSLINKVFTPRAIEALRPLVVETIDKYISQANPERFDVVQDFGALFPVEVITTMLGVPPEYRQKVREWTDISLHREPGQMDMSQEGLQAIGETFALYHQLIQERRAEPRDDMFSRLIAAEIEEDGVKRRLDDFEITSFATLLGGAGAETVTKLIGNAAVTFARFPDQWQKLLEDRSKIPAAVEELLRYEPPNHYNVRRSMREVTLHGVTIPEGKPVFLLGASANRDPEAFTDADTFDIDRDRTEAQNLAFGYGVHSCLGAALARMEGAIALERLLNFMPRYEVLWDECKRVAMQNVAGWERVPVRVVD